MTRSGDDAPQRVELEIRLQGEVIARRSFEASSISIGRSPDNDLVLAHETVSSAHARLEPRRKGIRLVDLASTAGTLIEKNRIKSCSISHGQSFQIGPYTIFVRLPAVPAGRDPDPVRVTPAARPTAPEEVRRTVENLLRLTAVVGVTDVYTVLERVLSASIDLLNASKGYVVVARHGRLSSILAKIGEIPIQEEGFSRTVCREALQTRRVVLLKGDEARERMNLIESLASSAATSVAAVCLEGDGEPTGVLYLEGGEPMARSFASEAELIGSLSRLGGRALQLAVDWKQLHENAERWQWLAQLRSEDAAVLREPNSAAMKSVMELVRSVATEEVTVLITGESGTGKEVTARTIHAWSDRRGGPFVAINCGAVPRDLVEAELFGVERGAFTGAAERRLGRLELANGGTLLLDEIGELPLDTQVKLLRVLEERCFERVGGGTAVAWDARVLAATNKDLKAAVASGQFRADLYYRLNVMTIELPALRDRLEDLDVLVSDLLARTNRKFRRKVYGVSLEALAALRAYDWPGNVRELRNVIERACLIEKSDCLTPRSLPFGSPGNAANAAPKPAATPAAPQQSRSTSHPKLDEFLMLQERSYLQAIVDETGGVLADILRITGMGRSTLYRKLKQYGITIREDPGEPEEPAEPRSS